MRASFPVHRSRGTGDLSTASRPARSPRRRRSPASLDPAGPPGPCTDRGESRHDPARPARSAREDGTTTAEYTVVTAAGVAFGALLLKLLTGSWGDQILETAFREVIKMLGF